MLMTVLRGELAIKQSRALIRIFRAMKDNIVETQGLVSQRDLLRVSMQTAENAEAIRSVQSTMLTQQKEISDQQKAIADQQKKILEHDDIRCDGGSGYGITWLVCIEVGNLCSRPSFLPVRRIRTPSFFNLLS